MCSVQLKVLTSSNFLVINENALNIAFVDPDTVTIRSGHEPSEIFILAPDWKVRKKKKDEIINKMQL